MLVEHGQIFSAAIEKLGTFIHISLPPLNCKILLIDKDKSPEIPNKFKIPVDGL